MIIACRIILSAASVMTGTYNAVYQGPHQLQVQEGAVGAVLGVEQVLLLAFGVHVFVLLDFFGCRLVHRRV